jgi:putative tryptophan/tyrosine transport system substrate-binding protein
MTDLRRREFLLALGSAAACPLAAWAQQPTLPLIGFLNGQTSAQLEDRVVAFSHGLNEAGFIEGQNASIEFRWADGDYDRLPALAADLVSRQVAVIVGSTNVAALAAKKATTTIPIVFTTNGDPVSLGLVTSLNAPNGNLTGVGLFSGPLAAKRLGLLHGMVPRAQVIAVLMDPKTQSYTSQRREAQQAARALGIKVLFLTAGTEGEIDAAFAALAQQQVRALFVGASPYFTWSQRDQIVALAARHAIPAIYPLRDWIASGGLMSYGSIVSDTYRRVGGYVGKILKGAKPADLPIEQSSRFEYVINLKTAKVLGLEIPTKLLALADEVIE